MKPRSSSMRATRGRTPPVMLNPGHFNPITAVIGWSTGPQWKLAEFRGTPAIANGSTHSRP